MTIYGYIRVLTDRQTTENQRYEVENYLNKQVLGADVWINETISGMVPFEKRKIGDIMRRLKKMIF